MKKLILLMVTITISQFMIAQDCTDLFISEYVEGSGNNKAIELYNPTLEAIDLSDYNLVRYSNGGFEPHAVALVGTIGAESTFVVVLDKQDPNGTGFEQPVDSALAEKADIFLCPVYEVNKMMYFNGNDAVTLEKTNGDVVDIFARVGSPDPDNGWTDITDTTITWNNQGTPEDYTIVDYMVGPLFWLSWTKDHTLMRKPTVKKGVTENPDVFVVTAEYDSLPENTFENLGVHVCDCHENSIANNAIDINVTMYPNPVTNGEINIEAEENMVSVELLNTLGQVIKSENLQTSTKNYSLRINSVNEGVYFVKLTFKDKNTLVRKIVVE